jgi:hypothetical protein
MCGCNGGGGGGNFGLYGNSFFLSSQVLRRQGVNRGGNNSQAIQAVLRARNIALINKLQRFGIRF